MNARHLAAGALVLGIAAQSIHGSAQERPDPAALLAAQRDAMATFAFMDGVWRGQATTVLPSGDQRRFLFSSAPVARGVLSLSP